MSKEFSEQELMKVLFVNQYFPPEIEPSASKIYNLSRSLTDLGHKVTVITGFPNYPTGNVIQPYRLRLFMNEIISGFIVRRTFLIPTSHKRLSARIINSLSFLLSSIIRSIPSGKHDIVFASAPPLEIGIAGYIISRIKRLKFVFEIRDLVLDAAIEMNLIKNPTAIKLTYLLEDFLYKKADMIVTVTEGFKKEIISKGIPDSKIQIIPNSADVDFIKPGRKNNLIRQKLNLFNKFIVLYAGNYGVSQKLTTIVEAAALTKDIEDLVFLMVGQGTEKNKVEILCSKLKLKNMIFLGSQPRNSMPDFYYASDVCIVPLRKIPTFKLTVPSKLYECMAAGRPIILSVNGEARQILENANAGIFVEPENPNQMAEVIRLLYNKRSLLKLFGSNGRYYVEKYCSRERQINRYNVLLSRLLLRVPYSDDAGQHDKFSDG